MLSRASLRNKNWFVDKLGHQGLMYKNSPIKFTIEECHWLYQRGRRESDGLRLKASLGDFWNHLQIWDVAFYRVRDEIGFSYDEFARMAQGSGNQKGSAKPKLIPLP